MSSIKPLPMSKRPPGSWGEGAWVISNVHFSSMTAGWTRGGRFGEPLMDRHAFKEVSWTVRRGRPPLLQIGAAKR
jgi:hypothetical protein